MHVHASKNASVLRYSIFLMLLLAFAEAAVGIYAQSLALLSDAGHNFADSLSLILALYAVYLQAKPPTPEKTYGYHRAGVLAAFGNAAALVLIAAFIFYEAYLHLLHPEPIKTGWMTVTAALGFAIDTGVSVALLKGSKSDINMRGAFIHTAADAVSTGAIVIGGLLIRKTGIMQIDPILSFLISGLILWSSIDIVRETVNILLEGLPRGMALDTVRGAILGISGVEDVHDMHIWSLGSSTHALSCHVAIADIPPSESAEILKRINQVLEEDYKISRTTIQFEHRLCESTPHCYVPAEIRRPAKPA